MIVGRHVKTFDEADMGMLEGACLNAPYPFHWVFIKEHGRRHIVVDAGGEEMRLEFRRTANGDRSSVTINDPLFGPTKFPVVPFRQAKT